MNKFTFGNSKAATNFIDILSKPENKRFQRRCSLLIHSYFTKFNDIFNHISFENRIYFFELLRNDFESKVNSSSSIPSLLKGYILNIATTKHKLTVRAAIELNRQNQSKRDKMKNKI